MKSYLLTILLYFISISLLFISCPGYESANMFWTVTLLLFLGGSIISLALTIWISGPFKTALARTIHYGFPLSGLLFICGYLYELISILIRYQ